MKTKLTLILALLLLSGCASTNIQDLSVKNRTVKFSIMNVIVFEKTTEGLGIGNADIQKGGDDGTVSE